jgi:hypothetical protein
VVAANTFHHIEPPDRARWMTELARTVEPGGFLLVFEHNPFNPLTRRAVRLCPFDEGVELLRPREARALLTGARTQVVEEFFYFFFPRSLRWFRRLEPGLSRVPLGAQYGVLACRDPS